MLGKSLVVLCAAASLAALHGAAEACVLDSSQPGTKQEITAPQASTTGGQSYGDRNRGGPYGFYSYPRHRSVGGRLDRALPVASSGDSSHSYDRNYGSAYYGLDYGAPYYGGGYYDRGTYYRERRD